MPMSLTLKTAWIGKMFGFSLLIALISIAFFHGAFFMIILFAHLKTWLWYCSMNALNTTTALISKLDRTVCLILLHSSISKFVFTSSLLAKNSFALRVRSSVLINTDLFIVVRWRYRIYVSCSVCGQDIRTQMVNRSAPTRDGPPHCCSGRYGAIIRVVRLSSQLSRAQCRLWISNFAYIDFFIYHFFLRLAFSVVTRRCQRDKGSIFIFLIVDSIDPVLSARTGSSSFQSLAHTHMSR